jgi:hypothetical protein
MVTPKARRYWSADSSTLEWLTSDMLVIAASGWVELAYHIKLLPLEVFVAMSALAHLERNRFRLNRLTL